jgi:RNA 2',3'-cyclic 3'-phosphodiesterase
VLRLFFALQPAIAQSAALVADVAPLVKELEGRPSIAANVHATLCFVGAVDEQRLDVLRAAAAGVRGPRVQIEFDALDYWEKPQILCATAAESGAARELSTALADATTAAGFAPDRKPFRAHLTLARKISSRVARNFAWPRALAPMSVSCERFVLMESRRGDAGSTYSVVDSWPLYEK